MNTPAPIKAAALLSTLTVGLSVAQGQKIYWTDPATNSIQRADLDGSNVEDVVRRTLGAPNQIALDLVGRKMYWTDTWTDAPKIQRANLDGSAVEDLVVVGLDYPQGVALDVGAGKMYWTDLEPFGSIRRANMDGSSTEEVVQNGLFRPWGIALDLTADKIYWTDWYANGRIQRANLDGSGVQNLVTTGLYLPLGIALDVTAGKMYWAEGGSGYTPIAKIRRANLDGSNVQDLVIIAEGWVCSSAMALDVADGKLYWGDRCSNGFHRANLDGSTVEDLITDTPALGLGLDPTSRKMYWTDDGIIHRANLDGSAPERLAGNGFYAPSQIAVDPLDSKIYMGAARRANLDGSEFEDVVTGADASGIALDLVARRIYWTIRGNERPPVLLAKVQRADLAGTNVEDVITLDEYATTQGIALDQIGGKMYWVDRDGTIHRANLNGSNVEELVRGLGLLYGIAFDAVARKVYWTDQSFAQPAIQRSNLDGSNLETLVTVGLGSPRGIAVNVADRKMYWADTGTKKIQRANLDGSQVEDLVILGADSSPMGVAIESRAGPIPAVSQWGLIVMSLLLVLAATLISRRRVSGAVDATVLIFCPPAEARQGGAPGMSGGERTERGIPP